MPVSRISLFGEKKKKHEAAEERDRRGARRRVRARLAGSIAKAYLKRLRDIF